MPPRAGKSYITTLFSAWMIGRTPTGSVMRNCCTSTLYEKFSYDTRDVVKSEKFTAVFPMKLSDDKQSVRGWNTTEAVQVSYFGSGVGGTIIGFGATLVAISDDLFKSYEDAISEQICEKTWSWYKGTHGSRIEKNCPVIDIGTRWSRKDVIGRNNEEKYYDESVVISALDQEGKSFCEAVKTTEEYHDIKLRTPAEIWTAEYMQDPRGASGVLFQQEDLQRIRIKDINNQNVESVLGYIDVADEGSDYYAMAIGYCFKDAVYVTDVIFTKDNIDITEPITIAKFKQHKCNYVRVEVNNQGSVYIKNLRKSLPPEKVLGVNNQSNKHTRILMQYGFIKTRMRFLHPDDYARGSDYDRFIQQILEYEKAGKTKHDDAPDCLAGLAQMCQGFLSHLYGQ